MAIGSKVSENKVIFLFYHGGQEGKGEIYKEVKGKNITENIYITVKAYAEGYSVRNIGAVIAPNLDRSKGIKTGTNFLDTNYKQGDMVIIFGYSYGGIHAIRVASERPNIPIKLMIIIDASDGPMLGFTVPKDISKNVVEVHNYYQTNSSGTSSASGKSSNNSKQPNSGVSNSPGSRGYQMKKREGVFNVDFTKNGITHGNIIVKLSGLINSIIFLNIAALKH